MRTETVIEAVKTPEEATEQQDGPNIVPEEIGPPASNEATPEAIPDQENDTTPATMPDGRAFYPPGTLKGFHPAQVSKVRRNKRQYACSEKHLHDSVDRGFCLFFEKRGQPVPPIASDHIEDAAAFCDYARRALYAETKGLRPSGGGWGAGRQVWQRRVAEVWRREDKYATS